jgi:hypothetical protein
MQIFNTKIKIEQCKDTGMAVVLIFLLAYLYYEKIYILYGALGLHLFNMIYPQGYRPVAVVWLGLSHLLGTVASRIILSIVYLAVVTPVGLLRRMLGKDSLKLKEFKVGSKSVMQARNHTFKAVDIEHPY